jgi:hypothetical protein
MTDTPHDHDPDGTAPSDTQTPTGGRVGDSGLQFLIGAAIVVIGTNLLDGQILPTPIRVLLDTGVVPLAAASLLLGGAHLVGWYTSQNDHD